MPLNWSALTFSPDSAALAQLAISWRWLVREPFTPVLFSCFGDAFVELESGGIWWLNTGIGDFTKVADSVAEFEGMLKTQSADEWFLPTLVAELHAAGKVPATGECFTFSTLPVFATGTYDVANLNPVPAREHFGVTGDMLRQIHELPDGVQIQVKVP